MYFLELLNWENVCATQQYLTLILSFFAAAAAAEEYCGKSVKQLILPFEEVCDTS